VVGPEDLLRIARGLQESGGNGFLLSGGCRSNGTIPLSPFLDALKEIKDTTDLKVNVHTGISDLEMARGLVNAGVDRLSVDIINEPTVLRACIGHGLGIEDYRITLDSLIDAGGRVVPHFCVGMPLSTPEGELEVLELLSGKDIQALVILGFIPTPGTPAAGYPAASSERILDLIEGAVEKLDCPVLLGCMRPRRDRQLEREALEVGVNGIAVPGPQTLKWAREMGMDVHLRWECCAIYR